MKALVWPVATYGCESWTLRKNEERRLDAFEMKGLRNISAGFVDSKVRTQRSCLEKEVMQGTMPGARIGKGDHARPVVVGMLSGWTTSIRGQDSPWKSQSE